MIIKVLTNRLSIYILPIFLPVIHMQLVFMLSLDTAKAFYLLSS
jgi:hypothetical protein